MPMYLLDILVEEAHLYSCCSTIRTPLWITIRADGLNQSFDTRQVPASQRPSWQTPVRLVLNLPQLHAGHLKATLRTTGYLGEVLSVACSQVVLSALPAGRPGRFRFPLQNTQDFAMQAATLFVTASISEFAPKPEAPPSQPAPIPPAWPRPPAPATGNAWLRNTQQPPMPMVPDGWAGRTGEGRATGRR